MGSINLFPKKGNCHSCGGRGWHPAAQGKRKICATCKGTGRDPRVKKNNNTCEKCHGTGRYSHRMEHWLNERKFTKLSFGTGRTGRVDIPNSITCPSCGGTGKV